MVRKEIEGKLQALLNDANFLDEVAGCENMDAVLKQFRNHGVDASPAEIEEFLALQAMPTSTSELSADDLDAVSGGSVLSALYKWYRKITGRSSGGGGGHAFGGGGGGSR